MKKKLIRTAFITILAFVASAAQAQQTFAELEQLTVNENVTTVITASEPVKLIDISTDKVVGDKPLSNTIRIKPKEAGHQDGDILAILTVVTERYRAQYALIYTTRSEEAVSDKEILVEERIAYNNPNVSMSFDDMIVYARKVWNTPAKIRNVKTNMHKMEMRLNNVYSFGNYFFIDFSVHNKTNIKFDIDEIRVKLEDKKKSKATTSQTIELKPAAVLDKSASFKKGYRNVIVLEKLTFPNDKVLTIELSERQISGRTISLSIDYEELLAADSFDPTLLREE